MRLLTVVRRESPVTLAREVLWRAQKSWRQKHLWKKLDSLACPVTYLPAGYYQPKLDQLEIREKQLVVRYADSICNGQFPWFSYGSVALGFPPHWSLDFVSGRTWPKLPSAAIQVARHDGSDVKVPWDLSRLQFLPVLGKAWRLSGKTQYRQAGKDLLSDWIAKNPVGVGVNWTIAMEAALRAISICLLLELLAPWSEAELPWVTRVTQSLWQHLLFIEAHNEFSHLIRGNHYLSNIVGLFCLTCFLQGPGMQVRRRRYQQLIEKEIVHQVYEDGGTCEASTGYHVLCLQMFTNTYLLMRSLGLKPVPAFTKRLRYMYQFLAALADAHGRVPHLGDCDDGRIELLSDDLEQMMITVPEDRYSLTVSGLLGIGESLFDERYSGRKSEAVWYGTRHTAADRNLRVARPLSLTFANSGLAVARVGDFEVIFACMPNGIAGKGSHTHNDKLSFIVRVAGEDVFTDPGTGCYTRDAQLRNQLRSTAAHNTLQIDREEQNRLSASAAELFRSFDDARVSPIETERLDGTLVLRASHEGYGRLGVRHTRTVTLTPPSSLKVEDLIEGSESHRFDAFLHLTPSAKVAIEHSRGETISCHIIIGERAIHMMCRAPVDLDLSSVPTVISTAYGLTRKATAIVVSGTFRSSLNLSTNICLLA